MEWGNGEMGRKRIILSNDSPFEGGKGDVKVNSNSKLYAPAVIKVFNTQDNRMVTSCYFY